ncbi:WapI family immunity protein [Mucilaginibacter limnophilus]
MVELKIVNYKFPYITTPDDWDSDWLNIYLNVKSDCGHWKL